MDDTLLLIATNAMLKIGAHPQTMEKWEVLDSAEQTWNAWKTAYMTANMKDRVQHLATGENASHGALLQTTTPQGTAIDDLVKTDQLEDYFDNIAASVTTEKVVIAQLTAVISAMNINNEALVATNDNLVEEVTTLTRRLGQNSDVTARKNASGQTNHQDLPLLQKRGLPQACHMPQTIQECKQTPAQLEKQLVTWRGR